MKPVLIDGFCCAGGAAKGYQRAGFYVIGVDKDPQPNYCGDEFFQADALDFIADHWRYADAIHTSPPCQDYTALKAVHGNEHPRLIPETRRLIRATGLPSVIENVPGAPLRRDVRLCGEMFGLGVIRHRYFEVEQWSCPEPVHHAHRGRVAGWRHGEWHDGPYFAVYGEGGGKGSVAQWQQAMGIDWTNVRREIAEAIPPAYAEYLGRHLLPQVVSRQDVKDAA